MDLENTGRIGGAMRTADLAFVDIETTGLNSRENEIIEIAVIRVRQNWSVGEKPVFEKIFEWSAKIKPLHLETADPVALKINGYIPSEWQDSIPLAQALKEFIEKTENAIMVAHNVAFDSEFINAKLFDLKIQNKMHYHRLDTVSFAFGKLYSAPEVGRYSLGELCKYFGIINTKAHSALSDAQADFELFKKLMDFKGSL
jgi:DNA polymerase III alpha subunit (gram-positive type)